MAHTAYLPIIADRYGAVVRHIFVVGLDLTGLDMRAQVRLYGDVPGPPLIDLLTVGNGNAQGLRLVEVTSDVVGLPTSHVELVINEATMEALPYAGEIGDVTTLAWDWQVTIAGRKRRLAKGEFQITGDGVTGADVAPVNRIQPYGLPQRPVADVWSSARMTFGEEQVTVQIDGADLVAPLAKKADDAAARAASDAQTANLAAGAAQAVSRYFTTRAAGEAASAVNQAFATDDGAGNVIYYKRTSGGSTEIGRAVTPAGLAAPAGSDLVGFAQNGGPRRSSLSKMRDSVSVKDFGAIGDRFEHPLSEFFPNLAAAQLVYPNANSMTNLIDGLAIQKAIAWGKANFPNGRGRIVVPGGGYRCNTGEFAIPNFMEFVGDGVGITIIDNQNTPVNYPLIVNDDAASFQYATIRNMTLLGGTHGIKITVTSEVAGLLLDNVGFALQTDKNFECNKLLQLSRFMRCAFTASPYGVYVKEPTTNEVLFVACSFERHDYEHIHFVGGESINFLGGRFEHGGVATVGSDARFTLYLDNVGPVKFQGTYFEATHPVLLKELNSRSGISFDGCQFTGGRIGDDGPFMPYKFETGGLVHFGTNHWHLLTPGPERMHITGDNGDQLVTSKVAYSRLDRSSKSWTTSSGPVPSSLAVNMVRISRVNTSAAASNNQLLTGDLTVNYIGVETGGFLKLFSRKYHVRVAAVGNASLITQITQASAADQVDGAAATMTVRSDSGATASQVTIQAAFTGLDPSTYVSSSLQWKFDYTALTTLESDYLVASPI